MAWRLPRLVRRLQPRLAHYQHSLPLRAGVPGLDRPRPLLRARARPDAAERPARLPRGRAAFGEARRPRDRRLGADAGGSRGPLRDPGQGRQGDPARHRSDLHAGRRRATAACWWSGRCSAARIHVRPWTRETSSDARGRRRPGAGAGARKRAARARRRRARLRGHEELPTCTARRRRSSSPPGTRASACRCWRRWRAGRPSSPRPTRRSSRWRATPRSSPTRATSPARSCTRSTGGWSCAVPGWSGRRASAGTKRAAHGRVYRSLL